jgi:hypothetical protein
MEGQGNKATKGYSHGNFMYQKKKLSGVRSREHGGEDMKIFSPNRPKLQRVNAP